MTVETPTLLARLSCSSSSGRFRTTHSPSAMRVLHALSLVIVWLPTVSWPASGSLRVSYKPGGSQLAYEHCASLCRRRRCIRTPFSQPPLISIHGDSSRIRLSVPDLSVRRWPPHLKASSFQHLSSCSIPLDRLRRLVLGYKLSSSAVENDLTRLSKAFNPPLCFGGLWGFYVRQPET